MNVIPANPGFEYLSAFRRKTTAGKAHSWGCDQEPIVAWETVGDRLEPVTFSRTEYNAKPQHWAVRFPGGRVYTSEGKHYETAAVWLRNLPTAKA